MPLARVDEHGRAARLGSAVRAFRASWPLGLAAFAFLSGSGRTGAGREGSRRSPGRWSNLRGADEGRVGWSSTAASPSSNNEAFDTCRTVELSRFIVQETKFRAFLNRLCLARDQEEFDRFVAEQRRAVAKRPSSERPGP